MKTTTHKNRDGRIELIAVITFFLILFFFTIFAGKASALVNDNAYRMNLTNEAISRNFAGISLTEPVSGQKEIHRMIK